jgi:N utilization substance protein A
VNVVREAGARTKIAVQSTNSDVDPVGACVGVKGSRVQMIVRELENEKIDIVPFSTNTKQFITAALVPAQIQSIETHEDRKQADVVVKQGNLSLAIGKRGQNAKLAARLTGWKLDIHSEGEEEKMANVDTEHVQRQYLEDFLTQIDRADQGMREAFYNSSYTNVHQLAAANAEDLAELVNGDLSMAEEIIEGAKEYMEALREMTRSNYGEDEQGEQGEEEQAEGEAEPTDAGEEGAESEPAQH